MNFYPLLAYAAIVAIALTSPQAIAAQVRPLQGPVVLARNGIQATYLWDASAYVTQLVADKRVGADGLQALEATAVTALADKARTSRANTLVLRIVYSRTGAVSPIYGAATFAGVEKVCTVTVRRRDAVRNAIGWAQAIADGNVPKGVTINVTGQLPPR